MMARRQLPCQDAPKGAKELCRLFPEGNVESCPHSVDSDFLISNPTHRTFAQSNFSE